MVQSQKKKFIVYGEIVVPVFVPVFSYSKETAMEYVKIKMSQDNIMKLDGDLHLADGEQHPIIAPRILTRWIDANSEEEL